VPEVGGVAEPRLAASNETLEEPGREECGDTGRKGDEGGLARVAGVRGGVSGGESGGLCVARDIRVKNE
jgi:hypothetical protein